MNPSFKIPLILQERLGKDRTQQVCQFSMPLICGQAHSIEQVHLLNSQGKAVECSKQVLGYWPDSSIKWLHCEFLASVNANQEQQWAVEVVDGKSGSESAEPIPEMLDTKRKPSPTQVRLKLKDEAVY